MRAIIVILPMLFSAIASLLMYGKEKWIGYVALGASIVSLLIAALFFLHNPGTHTVTWFSLSGYTFSLGTVAGPMNMLLLLLVCLITPLVMLYSMGFMRLPSEQRPFYFLMSIFAMAMMLFAVGGDLITIFLAWGLLGITSYLLIGFWRHRDSAMHAATKAITTVLIGDVMILAAIAMLFVGYHSLTISAIDASTTSSAIVKVALVLIILGAFTKSAQFPFNEWLADAMEGPTPVSAFLHSSTMVKAGVFLIALLLPLIFLYKLNYILLIFGIATAVIGAISASRELHIKRILAYSTMEDLGLMFVALGLNSIPAALLLFFVQTFYKALLFMSAGAIMKANGDEEDITKLHGPKAFSPLMFAILIGVASLAGIFPLSGFFGKAGVESVAGNPVIFSILLCIDLLSAIYIFRWFLVPMRAHKDKKSHDSYSRSVNQRMLIPIYLLAFMVVAASAIYPFLGGFLGSQSSLSIGYIAAAAGSTIAIIGAIIAYVVYSKGMVLDENKRMAIAQTFRISDMINRAYALIVRGVVEAGHLADIFEYQSYGLIKAGGGGFSAITTQMRRAEDGNLNYYLIVLVIGVIGVILLMLVV